jgi:hypothetical protein
MFVPTPDCGSPTLVLGTTTFQIQNLAPAADGSLAIPPTTSGIAYWVKGTDTNYVFVLPPMPGNLTPMSTLTVGSTAKVTWSNCNSNTYSLSAPHQSTLQVAASTDQSQEGINVFFETDVYGGGFLFTGGLSEQEIMTIDTPNPTEIQAEIGLLETGTSSDGTMVNIGVSINNYGASPITLSTSDISLTQADGTLLNLAGSKPRLPQEIKAGQTKNFEFTFPRPSSPTTTLKIFTVEYDIEGY